MKEKEVSEKHMKVILKELLKRVDAPENFDFDQEKWYLKYSWNESEQNDFKKWLAKFLRKHKYVTQKNYRGQDAAIYIAKIFIFHYGWKLKI